MTPQEGIVTAGLRAIAGAATPGPWRSHQTVNRFGVFHGVVDVTFDSAIFEGEKDNAMIADTFHAKAHENAAHIAAWHPALALASLDAIDGLRGLVACCTACDGTGAVGMFLAATGEKVGEKACSWCEIGRAALSRFDALCRGATENE